MAASVAMLPPVATLVLPARGVRVAAVSMLVLVILVPCYHSLTDLALMIAMMAAAEPAAAAAAADNNRNNRFAFGGNSLSRSR